MLWRPPVSGSFCLPHRLMSYCSYESREKKKIRGVPQYYELNALEAQMQNNDDSFADDTHDCNEQLDSDDSYYGTVSVDDEDYFADSGKFVSSYSTNIFSMNQLLADPRIPNETMHQYFYYEYQL